MLWNTEVTYVMETVCFCFSTSLFIQIRVKGFQFRKYGLGVSYFTGAFSEYHSDMRLCFVFFFKVKKIFCLLLS